MTDKGTNPNPACMHCGSHETKKNGYEQGYQRYKCKQCKRTFVPDTPTPTPKSRSVAGLYPACTKCGSPDTKLGAMNKFGNQQYKCRNCNKYFTPTPYLVKVYPPCPQCKQADQVVSGGIVRGKASYKCKRCPRYFIPDAKKKVRCPDCPRCGSEDTRMNGTRRTKGKQGYYCHECRHGFTEDTPKTYPPSCPNTSCLSSQVQKIGRNKDRIVMHCVGCEQSFYFKPRKWTSAYLYLSYGSRQVRINAGLSEALELNASDKVLINTEGEIILIQKSTHPDAYSLSRTGQKSILAISSVDLYNYLREWAKITGKKSLKFNAKIQNNMAIISRKSLEAKRPNKGNPGFASVEPFITIGQQGTTMLNVKLCELLQIENGEKLVLDHDEEAEELSIYLAQTEEEKEAGFAVSLGGDEFKATPQIFNRDFARYIRDAFGIKKKKTTRIKVEEIENSKRFRLIKP